MDKPMKPFVRKPAHARDPNNASPKQTPTKTGNNTNSDKDYSKWSEVPPEMVNKLHSRDDVDTSWSAHHHTTGIRRNQASPGDHDHAGFNSRKLGHGLGYAISGSKGGNAALASVIAMLKSVIEFTDTTT